MASSIPKKILNGKAAYSGRNLFDIFRSASNETPPGALPLLGGVINSCDTIYPEFWEKAVELKKSKMISVITDSEYNTTLAGGLCHSFVVDETNKKIRLPYLKDSQIVAQGMDSNGNWYRIDNTGFCECGGTQPIVSTDWSTRGGGGDNPMFSITPPVQFTSNSIHFWSTIMCTDDAKYGDSSADYVSYNYQTNIIRVSVQSYYGQYHSNVTGFTWRVEGQVDLSKYVKNVSGQPLPLYIQVYNPDAVEKTTIQANQILEQARQYYEKIRTIEINIKSEIESLRIDNAMASMPDITRAVPMEKSGYDTYNDLGLIWKINVPGWFVPHDNTSGRYDAEYDWIYHVANHPGYLYQYTDDTFGYFQIPSYSARRTTLACLIAGDYGTNFQTPIVPGSSTYFHLGDAASPSWADKRLWFVPCRAVPTTYPKSGFVTPVATTKLSISRNEKYDSGLLNSTYPQAAYAGKWADNFTYNSSTGLYELDTSKIIMPKYQYSMTGSGTWMNGWEFYQSNSLNTGKSRIWYGSGGTYTMRFITSAEIDVWIAELKANYSGYLANVYGGKTAVQWCESYRNKWVICAWNKYRKQFLNTDAATTAGLDLVAHAASDFYQMPEDYHASSSYEGDNSWNFWQGVYMVSVDTNQDDPPSRSSSSYANGSGQWTWGGGRYSDKDNLAYLPNCQLRSPIPQW